MLRMGHSQLKVTRCYRKCGCGKTETINHLFLPCRLTEDYRNVTFNKIHSVLTHLSSCDLKLDAKGNKDLLHFFTLWMR